MELKTEQSPRVFDPNLEPRFPSSGNLGDDRRQRALQWLQLLWNGRRFLAECIAAGLAASILLAILIPPKYESTTRLMPPDNRSDSMALLAAMTSKANDSALGDLATDVLGIQSSGALFVGILRSRTVQDALIQRFDLRRVYSIRRWEDTRKELERRTAISEARKSGIIEIRVRDRSPQRAQALAKAYVEELDRAVNKLSTSAARREREFLETRLSDVKKELDQASRDFSQFASQNTAIDIPAQAKTMVEAAAMLQGQLIAAESEKQGLEQIYAQNNVRVRTVEARIAELKRQLEKVGSGGTGQDENGGSDTSETTIYPSIRKLPLLGVSYFDLYRRTKIQEAVFEALTKRYELAKVQEAKEIPTVRVLDPGDLPEKSSALSRLSVVCLGLFIALLLGCAWILAKTEWEQLDTQDPSRLFLLGLELDAKRDWEQMKTSAARIRSRMMRRADKKIS